MIPDLRRVLELGRHRELNAGIRSIRTREAAAASDGVGGRTRPADRLLAGLHDVAAFAAAHHRDGAVRDLVRRLAHL